MVKKFLQHLVVSFILCISESVVILRIQTKLNVGVRLSFSVAQETHSLNMNSYRENIALFPSKIPFHTFNS